jgi:hypothetical protein
MATDKARNDMFFNCSKESEVDYVAGNYDDSKAVKEFLKKKCGDGTIKYSRHKEVYELIKKDLGYDIPVHK